MGARVTKEAIPAKQPAAGSQASGSDKVQAFTESTSTPARSTQEQRKRDPGVTRVTLPEPSKPSSGTLDQAVPSGNLNAR
jgi:hypothetical protein